MAWGKISDRLVQNTLPVLGKENPSSDDCHWCWRRPFWINQVTTSIPQTFLIQKGHIACCARVRRLWFIAMPGQAASEPLTAWRRGTAHELSLCFAFSFTFQERLGLLFLTLLSFLPLASVGNDIERDTSIVFIHIGVSLPWAKENADVRWCSQLLTSWLRNKWKLEINSLFPDFSLLTRTHNLCLGSSSPTKKSYAATLKLCLQSFPA